MEKPDQLRELWRMQKALNERMCEAVQTKSISAVNSASHQALERKVK